MHRVATIVLISTLLAGFTARPARAQSACRSAPTQSAMTRCAEEGARVAIRRLDSLLTELYPRLDSARASGLRQIQTDWQRVRDAHCRWDADTYEGGSVMPMWYSNCVAAATYARIEDLRFHLCEDDAGMGGECSASLRFARPAEKPRRRR